MARPKAARVRLATPWYVWALAVLFAVVTITLLAGPAEWSRWAADKFGSIGELWNP